MSFFLDSEGKLKCSGEVNSAISAPSAAALRRLRSETRLRAQSAEVLLAAKRSYGALAPPATLPRARWMTRAQTVDPAPFRVAAWAAVRRLCLGAGEDTGSLSERPPASGEHVLV